jgi:hypothetical protein
MIITKENFALKKSQELRIYRSINARTMVPNQQFK